MAKNTLWRGLALFGAAACAAAALVLYGRCGGSAAGALFTWMTAAVGAFVPGAFVMRLVCRRRESRGRERPAPLLFAVCASLWGFALFIAVSLAASVWRAPALSRCWWELWTVYAVMRLAIPQSRRALREDFARAGRFLVSGTGAALCLVTGVLVALNALYAVRYAHPAAVGALVPSQDFFWNLGNMESFSGGLPLADLRIFGLTIVYHFLTELFEAGLWFATKLPAYDVVAFYAYAPIAALLVASLYALGRQLWKNDACRRRAVLLSSMPLWLSCASLWKALSGASRFGNTVPVHTLSNINGQATAFFCLACTLLFLDRVLERERPDVWEYVSLALAFGGLSFAKSPEAAILAIAVLCAAAVLLAQKRVRLSRAAFLCLLFPVGFAALYKFYYTAVRVNSSLHFTPTGTLELFYFKSILNALQSRFPRFWGAFLPPLYLAQSFLAAPAAFCAWAWAGVDALRKKLRVRPVLLVLHASAVGGFLAFFLFDHTSSSQLYFANLAIFAAGIFLIDRLPALLRARKKLVPVCAAALFAAGCVTSLCQFASIGKTAAGIFAGTWDGGGRCVLTADEENACAWMAGHLPENKRFATNRMHTGAAMEGLSNVYSGLSGRGAYLESYKYATHDPGAGTGEILRRYKEMEELFAADTTPERVREICAEGGIELLLYCPLLPGDEAHLSAFPCVFESENCRIYEVSAQGGEGS